MAAKRKAKRKSISAPKSTEQKTQEKKVVNTPPIQEQPKAEGKETNEVKTKRVGKGSLDGTEGKRFSKEYQPSPEAKAAGKKAAKTIREFLNMPLKQGRISKDYEKFVRECVNNYGISRDQINHRLFLDMRMASLALKGDVSAYKALLDRAIGKPMTEQPPVIEVEQGEKSFISFGNGSQLEI